MYKKRAAYRDIKKIDVPAWWRGKRSQRRWIKRQSSKRMRRLARLLAEDAPKKPYKARQ